MPGFIATFDLQDSFPQPHGRFLSNAQLFGWLPSEENLPSSERMRDTILVGDFSDVNTATEALLKAAEDLASRGSVKVKLTRWMVAQRTAARYCGDVQTSMDLVKACDIGGEP